MDYLYAGLGNPGNKYEGTRHNLGAEILRSLFPVSLKESAPLHSLTGEITRNDDRIYLIFPQTFMNLSGKALQAAAKKWRISPENIVVFHDEIELLPGQVRYKFGGGHKGHNGLRDILRVFSNADFHRIRLGVGRPENPSYSVSDYVLSRISASQWPALEDVLRLLSEQDLPH